MGCVRPNGRVDVPSFAFRHGRPAKEEETERRGDPRQAEDHRQRRGSQAQVHQAGENRTRVNLPVLVS